VQATVDVSSVIGTPTALQNLRLRFQAASRTGNTFTTRLDLVHVDVN
jgi:hypothetical protein